MAWPSPSYLEGLSTTLPARVFSAMAPRFGRQVAEWAAAAAASFSAQLADNGATPHRFFTDQYSGSLGFSNAEAAALGDVLDVLQVSFDLADNLADREVDRVSGRDYFERCENVPLAVLTYLPAVLAARAIDILQDQFPGSAYSSPTAVLRLEAAIGAMVCGQAAAAESPDRVELLSGEQGRLLCLPFWLRANDDVRLPCGASSFESWAYEFGRSWELHQIHRRDRSAGSLARWIECVKAARSIWPSFGPFGAQGPLAADALFPLCLC